MEQSGLILNGECKMMRKRIYISIGELAKIIKIHSKTLRGWLCHYSLAKFSKFHCRRDGKSEYGFLITKESVKALKKYLTLKKCKYLDDFYEKFKDEL